MKPLVIPYLSLDDVIPFIIPKDRAEQLTVFTHKLVNERDQLYAQCSASDILMICRPFI